MKQDIYYTTEEGGIIKYSNKTIKNIKRRLLNSTNYEWLYKIIGEKVFGLFVAVDGEVKLAIYLDRKVFIHRKRRRVFWKDVHNVLKNIS